MRELLLASTSPFRRRMRHDAGIRVRGVAPGVDEVAPDHITDVAHLVEHLAHAKARAVAAQHRDACVIGADQLAHFPGDRERWLGKPADPEAHLSMLQEMRGRAHVLVTGLAIVEPGFEHVSHHETVMHVRADVTDEELAAYVRTGEGSHCAAGYAAEGRGGFLFAKIEGDFFNVLGLPLLQVIAVLRARGWRFTDG